MTKKRHFLVLLIAIFVASLAAKQIGNATYYSSKLQGRHTSDGGKYHPDSMTCAHKTLPFGTVLKVRNPKNDKVVYVKVTDRGPHHRRLMIDLSYSAAKELDIVRAGIASVEITKLDSMPDLPTKLISDSIVVQPNPSLVQN